MWPQFLPDGHRFIYYAISSDPSMSGIDLEEGLPALAGVSQAQSLAECLPAAIPHTFSLNETAP